MWLKFWALCFIFGEIRSLHLVNNGAKLDLTVSETSTKITFYWNNDLKITGEIGIGKQITLPNTCENANSCTIQSNDISLTITPVIDGFRFNWTTKNTSSLVDCLNLNASNVHWYGGPEKWQGDWPIENDIFQDRPYISSKNDNSAIAERYWLNSLGAFIFVHDSVPLYLDQNSISKDQICFTASARGPYVGTENINLDYVLVAKEDPRVAHLSAINNFLGKPKTIPNEWVIRNPIWTTWAKYKRFISDEIVLDFATDIANHGFGGQIEIDDNWETCYGSLTFNDTSFAKINETVQKLKDLNFTVTLWTHPFVNDNCPEPAEYGREHDLFVKSRNGSDETNWWNGDAAHYIDFTKEEARDWFTERLELLKTKHGIDSFKFDAGENDWAPPNPVLYDNITLTPNSLTSDYVKTCFEFAGLMEVRAGFRTQELGTLVRQLDKDSRWGFDNGLQTLITSLLTINLNGYVFVLPDMIGGNGYSEQPTAELIARWTQANTFMPTMQFSYLPWEVTSDQFDNLAIVKKFVQLHYDYSDLILKTMNDSIINGTPVNPPIWWVDPTNPDALKSNDQYLLGDQILVAPVVKQGAISRDIVIPTGSWKDANTGILHQGPKVLKNYPAPIDVLPYFIKQ